MEYSCDDADRLIQVDYRGKTFTFNYDNADSLTEVHYPNGITKFIDYTDTGMVEQIKFGKNQGVLYQADYWYDSASRRTRKDITIPGQGTTRFD